MVTPCHALTTLFSQGLTQTTALIPQPQPVACVCPAIKLLSDSHFSAQAAVAYAAFSQAVGTRSTHPVGTYSRSLSFLARLRYNFSFKDLSLLGHHVRPSTGDAQLHVCAAWEAPTAAATAFLLQ